jgi:hypothetical protein
MFVLGAPRELVLASLSESDQRRALSPAQAEGRFVVVFPGLVFSINVLLWQINLASVLFLNVLSIKMIGGRGCV